VTTLPRPRTSARPGLTRVTRTAGVRRTGAAPLVGLALAAAVVGGPGAAAAPGPAGAPLPGTAVEARTRLEDLTARLAAAETAEAAAEDRAAGLAREAEETRRRLDALRDRLGIRARAMYTSGVAGSLAAEPMLALLTSDRPTAAVDRLAMLDAAQGHDNGVLEETLAAERRLAEQQAEADAAREQAAAAKADLQRNAAEMDAVLARLVAAEEARARAAAERSRLEAERAAAATASVSRSAGRAAAAGVSRSAGRAAAAVDTGTAAAGVTAANGQACPVGPVHSFVDSWGAARSGGRAHKGTDVMAPYGASAYAVVDGTISRAGGNGLGGIVLYLTGANGDRYYYAHNAVNLVSVGQQVVAGQEIAKVGNSGNAAGGAAHIHFEVHPGGGSPVNPYPFLRGVCG
jgi:murein DD-endopeptidase MepM/ murein hydrolase activator NlpD